MHAHLGARVHGPWRERNSCWRREKGTSGREDPKDTSQRIEDFMKGTDRIKREVLESMDWTEGHSDCRIGRVEKSKPEAERSRDVAEKTGKAEDLTRTRLKGQDRVLATTYSEPGT